jgi:hypothetical protein
LQLQVRKKSKSYNDGELCRTACQEDSMPPLEIQMETCHLERCLIIIV